MGTQFAAAMVRYARTGWLCSAVLLLTLLSAPTAFAAVNSGAISQSYKTSTDDISQGTLLSVTSDDSTVVEPANSTSNGANIIGVAADKPLVELSGNGGGKVSVVVSGSTEILASDVNGVIHVGDKITASPIGGIGMKAVEASEIVGTAQANFDDITTVSRTIKDSDGAEQTIKVGLLPLAVNISYYATTKTAEGMLSSLVPPFLQALANSVTGRQVSPLRVMLGTSALFFGFVTVTVMLYASIRSGVISLGRNPLAEKSLRKGLVDVVVAAIGLLVITIVVAYVVLLV